MKIVLVHKDPRPDEAQAFALPLVDLKAALLRLSAYVMTRDCYVSDDLISKFILIIDLTFCRENRCSFLF